VLLAVLAQLLPTESRATYRWLDGRFHGNRYDEASALHDHIVRVEHGIKCSDEQILASATICGIQPLGREWFFLMRALERFEFEVVS
jgi:hypothetical protein